MNENTHFIAYYWIIDCACQETENHFSSAPGKLTSQPPGLAHRDSPDAAFQRQPKSFMTHVFGVQLLQMFCAARAGSAATVAHGAGEAPGRPGAEPGLKGSPPRPEPPQPMPPGCTAGAEECTHCSEHGGTAMSAKPPHWNQAGSSRLKTRARCLLLAAEVHF